MNRLQPAFARAVTAQIHGGFHVQQPEFSVGRSKHLLALVAGEAGEIGQRRHRQQIERIELAPGQVHRRHGSGERFLGLLQRGLELVGRQTVGQRGKIDSGG